MEYAYFAGGCFWCLEAVFNDLKGVREVASGYAGGTVANPTYEQVCSETTGHAETVRITFDPTVITYNDLLGIFFDIHDPTTKDRQGNDVGTSYRSAIFYANEGQREQAVATLGQLDASRIYRAPIVTEILPLDVFYPAEGYHQDYFARNPGNPYCRVVVSPKVAKFRSHYADLLK